MAQRRIVVVEDESDLADLVALHLRREGYEVTTEEDGEAGWGRIERDVPDLVVLDLMLPGIDGFEICRRMRRSERLTRTPVLILTARGEDSDVVAGLELGADDYVTKPFSPRVLVARVRTLFRRAEGVEAASEVVRLGDVEVDTGRHEVRVDGTLVELTGTEFGILHYLAARPGRVRTRAAILEAIGQRSVLDRTVDVHLASLRKKLGASGALLETVRGIGYRARD
jgi:two-component system phosphate regulon response regulator PhoB